MRVVGLVLLAAVGCATDDAHQPSNAIDFGSGDTNNDQSQVNDPPPKQSIWVDILLGAVSAAFGGFAAGTAIAVSKKLMHKALKGAEVTLKAEAIQEGVKSFMEQGAVAAAQHTFSKAQAAYDYPHVAFFKFMESAITTKERDFNQLEWSNKISPQLDDLESKQRGAGFAEAMRLDRAMKEDTEAVDRQQNESFKQWIPFVTKAQLGEHKVDPNSQETGTNMNNQLTESNKTAPEAP